MYILTLAFLYSQITKMTACNIAQISDAEKKKKSVRVSNLKSPRYKSTFPL